MLKIGFHWFCHKGATVFPTFCWEQTAKWNSLIVELQFTTLLLKPLPKPKVFSWKCSIHVLIQVYKWLKDWFRLLFIFVLDEIRLEKWLVWHERELVLLSNVEGTVLLQNVKQVLLAKSWSWFTIILCNQEAAFAQKWVGIQIRTLLSIFNLTLFSHVSKTNFLNR